MARSRVTLLAWLMAIAFIGGTILQFVDRLNLVATPPDLPNANMVDRTLGSSAYLHAIWPVFLWTNLLFGIGFLAAVAFAFNLASAVRVPGGLPTFKSLVAAGGVIAAISSIIPIGAAEAKVFVQYCDCGFKETEVVSQLWAQMVAEDISAWFLRVASIVLAVGLIALVREGGTVVSATLRSWTYILAVALVIAPVLGVVQITDPVAEDLLEAITGAILLPVWAVMLARSVDGMAAVPPASS